MKSLHGKVRSPRWQKRRILKLLEDGVTVWCQSYKTSSRAKEQQSCKFLYYVVCSITLLTLNEFELSVVNEILNYNKL